MLFDWEKNDKLTGMISKIVNNLIFSKNIYTGNIKQLKFLWVLVWIYKKWNRWSTVSARGTCLKRKTHGRKRKGCFSLKRTINTVIEAVCFKIEGFCYILTRLKNKVLFIFWV